MNFVVKVLGSMMFVLLVVTGAMSRELTLDDCIELALKNRVSIIAARGEETLAKWNQRWALGQFLPKVDAAYNYSKGKETDIDPPNINPYTGDTLTEQDRGPDKVLNFSAGMSIFDLTNWFNYFGARASRAAAHLDVIDSEQDLIYAVKFSYYAYLATVENVDVQQGAVKRSEEQLKLIQSKYDLGSAARSDVLKQKVQYGNDKLSLLSAENAVTTSRADLAYTIGMDPNSEVEFSTDYIVREFEGGLGQAIEFGLSHEPGLLASAKELDASRHAVRSRLAEYLPTLTAFADYTVYKGTQAFPVVFDYSFNSRTFGFAIRFNVFDGFSREREVSRARISRNNARAAQGEAKNLVTRDIKIAYLDIQQLKEAKIVAGENVEAATEDLKITQEKYNLGAATILDLLNAQVSLKEAQVSLIKADFDLNLAVAKLENATGKM